MMSLVSCDQQVASPFNSLSDPSLMKKTSTSFICDYDVGAQLGRGRFAKVCEVHCKVTGDTLAAKIIRRWRSGKDTIESVLREIKVLELGCSSKHIVGMRHYYLGPTEVVIILENSRGGDFFQLVHYSDETLPIDFVKRSVKQLLDAVCFLHEWSIVHLDIKPENILLRRPPPDCDVALCDFGLAKRLDSQRPVRDLVGTPDYAAPEILNYNPIHLTTDMWSVGVVTYYLITGVSPFWAATKEETFQNVCQINITYPDDLFEHVPQCAVDFIRRLIVKEPSHRSSAAQCFEDAWFTNDPPSGDSHQSRSLSRCSQTSSDPDSQGCSPPTRSLSIAQDRDESDLMDKADDDS